MLHAAILNSLKNVKVIAVTENEKFVLNFLQEYTSDIQVYDNYKKMIKNEDLDFVYITTPVSAHIEIASYCVNKQLPFFVEKPIGGTSKECNDLCSLLKNNNTINMVGFNLRYSDTFCKAKELLEKNELGDIIDIKATAFRSLGSDSGSSWRFKKKISGGGVLIDIGIHALDLLMWYFGNIIALDVKEVHAMGEVEDFVKASLTFENNINCEFETSWKVKNYRVQETTLEVLGSLANLRVSEDFLELQYKKTNQKTVFHKPSLYQGIEFDVGGTAYTKEDLDFINCVKNSIQSKSNVIESSKVQYVVDSIYKSAENKIKEVVKYYE